MCELAHEVCLTSFADASAARQTGRVFPQHQAAITLLQGLVGNPRSSEICWLDLACGRGQIISSLDDNLKDTARRKVHYFGYDINDKYVSETSQRASSLGLAGNQCKVGDLSDFPKLVPPGSFDFVTLTNAVHEIPPRDLASILVECILRLSPTGTLFVYDMETLDPPELGAIPWLVEEIGAIFTEAVVALGARDYEPQTGQWPHKTCKAWNVQIHRAHLGVDQSILQDNANLAIQRVDEKVTHLLSEKLKGVESALEAITRHGAETPEETIDKERYLYLFWSVSRVCKEFRRE